MKRNRRFPKVKLPKFPKIKETYIWISIVIVGVGGCLLWFLDDQYDIFNKSIAGAGGGGVQACYLLPNFITSPNGSYTIPNDIVCREGVWVNTSKTDGIDRYCDAYYKLVQVSYTASGATTNVTEAKGHEFCQNGVIKESPMSCGDYNCSGMENEANCWFDCGPIQSWELMRQRVQDDMGDLSLYLASISAFAYEGSPAIDKLAKEVEATNPKTPLEAIRTLTRLIGNKIAYVYGGVVQCGENSDTILNRGTGNCVDYSTVMIATLRRGFDIPSVGRVKIPVRQVAGCVSGFKTWGAVEYKPEDDKAGLLGEILGHSWVEIWVGKDRFVMADPTTNTALARSWWGYHKTMEVKGVQECYIAHIEDREFCQTYGTTAVTSDESRSVY